MIVENWTMLGAAVVGVVFVAAALMKVAAPFSFYRHVARFDILPHLALRISVPLAIGLEGGWGAALAVGLVPQLMLPFTAVALVVLAGVTWWSVKSGKAEDCGCYGGFITPSIWQSIGLNGFYFLLILAAWATLPAASVDAGWKVVVVALTTVLFGATAEYALRSEFSTGVPLFTPSPLRIGQRWKAGWAGTARDKLEPAQLLAYLGPDCPYCKRWVRALNVIHASPALPPVTAILSSSQKAIDDFVVETNVRFPIATISPAKMQRLSSVVPTTVLIERGTIQDVWKGAVFSESFTSRFKTVFFPSNVEPPSAADEAAADAAVTVSR